MKTACYLLLTAFGLLSVDSMAGEKVKNSKELQTERGPVSATVRIEPNTVRIGDPVTLTIDVKAEPDVELLMPVFGSSLERFLILEFTPRESVDSAGRTRSTQIYRLQAPASGQHSIPPITVEFVDRRPGQRTSPDDGDAYELLTERLDFTVQSVVPEGASDDLRPPLKQLAPIEAKTTQPWSWAAVLSVLLAIALLFALTHRLRKRAQQQSAYEIALNRLTALEARPRPDSDSMDGFFVELSSLVRRYLESRFALHAPELTTEEFLDVAAISPDLTRQHRSFLQTFLKSADRVKFARHIPAPGDVETALSAVREFLNQTTRDDPGTRNGTTPGAIHA